MVDPNMETQDLSHINLAGARPVSRLDRLESAVRQALDPIAIKLVEGGIIEPTLANNSFRDLGGSTEPFSKVLLKQRRISEQQYYEGWALSLGIPYENLERARINEPYLRMFERDGADLLSYGIFPLGQAEGKWRLAISDPALITQGEVFKKKLGREVEFCLVTPQALDGARSQHLRRASHLGRGRGAIGSVKSSSPVPDIINNCLEQAIIRRASDIQIMPTQREVVIRFKIDGSWVDWLRRPRVVESNFAAAVKVIAGQSMDPSNRLITQDGSFSKVIGGESIDFRVSSTPVRVGDYNGESVVIRVLRQSSNLCDLRDLDFGPQRMALVERFIRKPQGLMMVIGPTGSGKTTTLYAALRALHDGTRNILTIEDPVEYCIDGIAQMQVNRHKSQDFAMLGRAVLRQAPDVVLIGEIRDPETADIAAQFGQAGQLVFSTIHANDSVAVIRRLIDLGIDRGRVSDLLQGVLSQRLVRKLCGECSNQVVPASEEELKTLEIDQSDAKDIFLSHPVGCDACSNTGYNGRLAAFETLEVTDELRDLICEGARMTEIIGQAKESGSLLTLEDSARSKVIRGKTSMEEYCKLTGKKMPERH